MRSLADRLALARGIQALWYPQRTGAWLKAVPVTGLLAEHSFATPRDVLQAFLDDGLYYYTPEDSAYGSFTTCAWRPVTRAELERCVDAVLGEAAAGIARVHAEEAAERAQAEAEGWHRTPQQPFEGDMIDLDALRRWFTDELWGEVEPTWFTNIGPDYRGEPAVIGVDHDVLALLWRP